MSRQGASLNSASTAEGKPLLTWLASAVLCKTRSDPRSRSQQGFSASGATGKESVPSNVTKSAVVDSKGSEESADTNVKVEDAVVAKAPDGKEIDFKKISIQEALDALRVGVTPQLDFLITAPQMPIKGRPADTAISSPADH